MDDFKQLLSCLWDAATGMVTMTVPLASMPHRESSAGLVAVLSLVAIGLTSLDGSYLSAVVLTLGALVPSVIIAVKHAGEQRGWWGSMAAASPLSMRTAATYLFVVTSIVWVVPALLLAAVFSVVQTDWSGFLVGAVSLVLSTLQFFFLVKSLPILRQHHQRLLAHEVRAKRDNRV